MPRKTKLNRKALRRIILSEAKRLGTDRDSKAFASRKAASAIVGVLPHCAVLTTAEMCRRLQPALVDAAYSLNTFPN